MAMDKKNQYFEEIRILRRTNTEQERKIENLEKKITHFEKLTEEHEKMLPQLMESAKQYRILAENTLDWVFWLDPNDRLVYISPSCRRITGYDAEEFLKDPKLLFKIIHQEDRDIFEDHRRFMHKTKAHGEEEFRILCKDGKTRWISHACHAVYDDAGEYAGILSSNCDSTDRREAEEKLSRIDQQAQTSDNQIETLINAVTESFFVMDMDGHILYANEATAKRLDIDIKTLIKKHTMFDLLPPEVERKYLVEIQKTGKPMRLEDERFEKTIWNSIYPVAGKDGRITQFAVFAMDITDRKASEAAIIESQLKLHEAYRREAENKLNDIQQQMQEAEEKLGLINRQLQENDHQVQALINAVTESFFVMDLDGHVLFANETTAERLGTDLGTLIKKKTMFDLLPPEVTRKYLIEIQKTGKPMRLENERFGKTIWHSIYPVAGEDGRITQFAVFGMDITDRKASEAAMIESQRKLHETKRREVEDKLNAAYQQTQENDHQFQTMINAVTESFFVMDLDGHVLFANETTAKRLGTDPGTLIKKKTMFDLLPPEVTRKYLIEIQKTGKTVRLEDERFGKTIWHSIYPVAGKDGRITQFAVIGMDITDRKASEVAILESQRKLDEANRREAEDKLSIIDKQTQENNHQVQALINAVTESFFVMDMDGHALYANETTAKRLGTNVNTLIKKQNMFDLLPPDVAARRKKYLEDIRITGKPMRFEDERFGRTIWNSIYPIEGEGGRVTQFAVFGMDITDRKASEVTILESQRKLDEANRILRQVIDTIPMRIFWKDKRSTYLGCNRLFAQDAGREKPEELIGDVDQNMVWRDQSERYRKDDLDVMTGGKSKIHYEEPLTTQEGNTIWLRSTKVPLTDLNGRIVGVLGTSEDITEQKQAAEVLAESEKRYRTLFENNSIPMLLIDPDTGVIMDANPAASVYYGWSHEELMHKKISHINTLREEEIKTEMAQARLQKRNHFLFKHRLASGDIRDVEVFTGPLQFRNKTLLYSAVSDVTDRLRNETVSRRSEKLDSLGILAGGLAHDFNNLMTVVQGHIDVASFDLEKDHPAKRALDAAQQTVDKTRDITGRLLTFSRGGDPVLKIIRIENFLESAVKSTLEGSPVDVSYEIPKDLWPVSADENQISQCFCNLAENAGEAMPDGGALNISAENVEVKAKDSLPLSEGSYVRITFEDIGSGIAKDHLPRIFDPYFSTKPMGKNKGMGLGLAVCYSVVKKHGGYIAVASEEAQGATFSLYLPAKPVLASRDALQQTNGAGALRKRILVMDDNEAIRKLLQLYIEQLGYDVTTATDGQQAIAEYARALDESKAYRAVILEVSVRQGWGGDVALMKLQKMNPDIKAVAIVSEDEDLRIDEYKECGFQNILCKPFRLEHVRQILEDILKS